MFVEEKEKKNLPLLVFWLVQQIKWHKKADSQKKISKEAWAIQISMKIPKDRQNEVYIILD